MGDGSTYQRIQSLKGLLEVNQASDEARTWWQELELLYLDEPERFLNVLEKLSSLRASFQEFQTVMAAVQYGSVDTGLEVLERAKRYGDGKLDSASIAEALNGTEYVMSPPEVEVWLEIRTLKELLDTEDAPLSAQIWWESFEREHAKRPEFVHRFLSELAARDATLADFFLAYVHSDTDNIQANLDFLDMARNAARGRRLTADDFKEVPGGIFPAEALPFDRAIPSYTIWYYPEDLSTVDPADGITTVTVLDEDSLETEIWALEEILDLPLVPEEVQVFWREFTDKCRSREARERWLLLLRDIVERDITLVELFLAYQMTNLNLFQDVLNMIEALRRLEGREILTLDDFEKYFSELSLEEGSE